ncbi:hypothetical protein GCM10027445_38210 [Amycolatopsis endophytica]|uniref:Uncharacterized protein n=1 Tax=Amycolatopsis endophytica TaxID=860233 RepID=A0A853B8Z7_9PSEU|nr:hypothetical protein [Amycolatopsis endophytica]NYI90906.1 hypothetical protein [Amycolatopsis endophytica]
MTQPQTATPVRRWRVPVVALVAGLVIGGGAVGLTWLGSTPARSDVATACEIVGRTTTLDPATDYAQYLRWGAAAQLAKAAAEQDPSRQALADALDKPVLVVQSTFAADGPEFETALSEAKAACAAL